MNLLSQLGGLAPVLLALPRAEGDNGSADGSRTVLAAVITLVVIGIAITIGLSMGKGARS